jgi:hypothetical protein
MALRNAGSRLLRGLQPFGAAAAPNGARAASTASANGVPVEVRPPFQPPALAHGGRMDTAGSAPTLPPPPRHAGRLGGAARISTHAAHAARP